MNRFFQRMVDQSQQIPEELQVAAINTREPGRLADLLASSLPFTIEEKQILLGEINVRARLERLGQYLSRQLAILELSTKIQEQVGSELTKAQRDHFLRQQLKAIQDELGESENENPEIAELWERIKKANPPAGSSERGRARARAAGGHAPELGGILDRPHLSRLAGDPSLEQGQSRPARPAAGPQGPGRRPLRPGKDQGTDPGIPGRAQAQERHERPDPLPGGAPRAPARPRWARASPRPWAASSSASAWGACTTKPRSAAIAALMSPPCPGRVIQGIRKAGTNNPVFMLDEVDKLGADFRGDPSAALLEVLDPEQNSTFRDHYLDVDFDLSKVMFIATANMLETIPSPLLDRLEVLQLPGYSEEEKTHIAQKYIIPKQLDLHGLTPQDLSITDTAIRKIIADYTREAGLRNLEREIAAICRKVARRRAEGEQGHDVVEPKEIAELLGPSRFFRELADRTGSPAWPPGWPGRRPAAKSSSSRPAGCRAKAA